MGFQLTDIQLKNWKNFSSLYIAITSPVVVIYGANAVGKTNIIEAIQLATTTQSFKNTNIYTIPQNPTNPASAALTLKDDIRTIESLYTVSKDKKILTINGKKTTTQEFSRYLPSLTFCPNDLEFLQGSATFRRFEIDAFGKLVAQTYRKNLQTYQTCLTQRNELLHTNKRLCDLSYKAVWDKALADGAAIIMCQRLRLIDKIFIHTKRIYHTIAPEEHLSYAYIPSWAHFATYKLNIHTQNELPQEICDFTLSNTTQTSISQKLQATLKQIEDLEFARQQTLIGAQRDEIVFYINGLNARTSTSQGQQRSLTLAWKLAETEVLHDIHGSYPLLLLDDVMSELDETRRSTIFSFIKNTGMQTIMTTANLNYFTKQEINDLQVVEIHGTNS